MRAATPPRYRLEGGRTCIDIKVRTVEQLFDGRDPAPFHERDLDEDAVEYILGGFQELPPQVSVKLVFWVQDETVRLPADTFAGAVRAHFSYEAEKLRRKTREHVRHGEFTLAIGLLVLTLFLSLAELTSWIAVETVRQILREGLVIIGWVAMWRPVEVLLYDWWPLVRQRRACERVLAAEISLQYGQGDGVP